MASGMGGTSTDWAWGLGFAECGVVPDDATTKKAAATCATAFLMLDSD